MPINVFAQYEGDVPSQERSESVAWLCDGNWQLPSQLFEFERWLGRDGKNLPKGSYVADIGFTPRSDAGGGGGALSVAAMQTLVMIGMELWFSEYPE